VIQTVRNSFRVLALTITVRNCAWRNITTGQNV